MKTGLITSDTSQKHDTGPGHPEQIARVSVIVDNFKKINNKNLLWKKPSKVSDDILLTTHEPNYINFVKSSFPVSPLCQRGKLVSPPSSTSFR